MSESMSNQGQQALDVHEELRNIAQGRDCTVFKKQFAEFLDERDALRSFRQRFCYPKKKTLPKISAAISEQERDEECIYLCGNSLGLKPKGVDKEVQAQLSKWSDMGVYLHFEDPYPAALCEYFGQESLGRLVGADPKNVILMNTLTVNLHLLMISFYQPTAQRYKIVIEDQAFPSDRYAMRSQIEMRGFSAESGLIILRPKSGQQTLTTEDICQVLEDEGDSIALVCLGGINYYTGQKFDMKTITSVAKKKGCMVGWDLAHAVGNVELRLDEWGVDFACWCTYKYLNSGAGCLGGAYVNNRHEKRRGQLRGWFGNSRDTRFQMRDQMDIAPGVEGFKLSNTSPVLIACIMPSLKIFDEAGMPSILEKQRLLTGYLEMLLLEYFNSSNPPIGEILTPSNPNERGSQLSIVFNTSLDGIFEELSKRGIVCDVRKPNVMRIAPAPLYNSFEDVFKFVLILKEVLEEAPNVSSLCLKTG